MIGAGPAGVSMALNLTNLGYDVTIYEKTGRVGGKSYDVKYRGVEYSLGTSFLEPDYFESVVPLARKYDAGALHPIPTIKIWPFNNKTDGAEFDVEFLTTLAKDFPENCTQGNLLQCGKFMADTVIKYIRYNCFYCKYLSYSLFSLHQELLGVYEGDFMQRPSDETLKALNMTFLEFLKKNDIEAMKIILQISNELQGYGYLDEISALYGLIWNKPKFMYSYVLTALKIKNPEYEDYIFRFIQG